MYRIADHGPVYYQFEQWTDPASLVHGVFTRLGGVSKAPWQSLNVGSTVGDDLQAVAHNRQLMAEALQINPHDTCTVWQVHGSDTIVMNGPTVNGTALVRADGMVTDRPGLFLVMRFADCVPILFHDPVAGVVGMAHAGWRGTVAGAGPSVVDTMVNVYGCLPANIQASIGPSIGPGHYQVGEEVVAAIESAFSDSSGLVHRASDGTAYLNLWEANRRALEAKGLIRIEVAGICTASHVDEFYSHRAERGKTGRFGAVIGMPAEG